MSDQHTSSATPGEKMASAPLDGLRDLCMPDAQGVMRGWQVVCAHLIERVAAAEARLRRIETAIEEAADE